jgi:hypothetical protein
MPLRLYSRSFWPNSQWSLVSHEKAIRLPLGGGEIRVDCESGDDAFVRFHDGEATRSVPSPCEIVCHSAHDTEQVLEIVAGNGETQRVPVIVGAGETFKHETLRDFSDFHERLHSWLSRTGKTVDDLFEALRSGRLTLLTRANPLSGLSTVYPFEEMLSACPSLLEICERPRLHLHIEEEIRPIGVVRRSGPAAIKHLSRHSEHWEARTIAGLRPARLLAQVLEDDWHLYENRFVITLLRKFRRYLRSTWEEIEGRLQQAISSIKFYDITDYTREQQPRALSYLLPDVRKDEIEDSWIYLADLHSRLTKLLRITEICRQSRLYQRLQDCREVQAPILNTNILAMDRRYRRARGLWDLIKDPTEVPQSGPDGALHADLTPAFVDFCQVLTIAALDVSGFKPIRRNTMLIDAEQSNFAVQGDYRRRDWVVSPRLEHAAGIMPWLLLRWSRGIATSFPFRSPWHPEPRVVVGKYEITSDRIIYYDRLTTHEVEDIRRLSVGSDKAYHRQQWAAFVYETNQQASPAFVAEIGLVPIFSKLVPSSRNIDGVTSDLLDRLIHFGAENKLRSTYALLPVAFSDADEGSVAADATVRRLLNFGDRYASEDAIRWGGFRAGIIPISRDQFPSLSRIAQLLNYQTTRFGLESGFLADECPLCGNERFGEQDGVHTCHSETCGCVWLLATCASCHSRFPTMRKPRVTSSRDQQSAQESDRTFLQSMLTTEEVSDPRTGAAPQPFFCTSNAHLGPTVICPYCGLCSESSACPRSCIYQRSVSLDASNAHP